MRYILFIAVFGVVSQGVPLSSSNPAATAFAAAAGKAGIFFFGIVLWCAGITSVVGASYTSVSFWKTLVPAINNHERAVTGLFILASTIVFIQLGHPVALLVLAGAVNGLILPIALAMVLVASRMRKLTNGYEHPIYWQVIGWIVVIVMSWMGAHVIGKYLVELF
jgi:Mn2+/Fe2+ NRAMP family transporter